MQKLTKVLIALVIVAVITGGAWAYYDYRARHPNTADAYIGMHVVRLAPQVSGPLAEVRVHTHQAVKAGDLLLVVDPKPFQLAVDAAQARLQAATEAKDASDAAVSAAQAELDAAKARYHEASRHAARVITLAREGTVSRDERDSAAAASRTALQGVHTAEAQLAAARAKARLAGGDGEVAAARAALEQAKLDLSHTRLVAPADGVVGDFDLRPGGFVVAGQPVMALVETRDVWVDANYKETEVGAIKPGQHATVSVDMLPDQQFKGEVMSLSPASGAAFSLLPPENATGNWVKVTQRFPVRVRILNPSPELRIGASASVTIDASGS